MREKKKLEERQKKIIRGVVVLFLCDNASLMRHLREEKKDFHLGHYAFLVTKWILWILVVEKEKRRIFFF